jgi:hypothetical protein
MRVIGIHGKNYTNTLNKMLNGRINLNYEEFYKVLFEPLVEKFGEIDDETITSVIGFSGGGPVSLSSIRERNLYVSCELSCYPEQNLSSEGIRYEFFSQSEFSEDWCHAIFTALGGLSFQSELGDGHRIVTTGLIDGGEAVDEIQLKLFSKSEIDGSSYGLYEVLVTKPFNKRVNNGLSGLGLANKFARLFRGR